MGIEAYSTHQSLGLPLPAVIAAAGGIVGSAWNSGGQGMLSALTVPGLLSTTSPVAPRLLAQQWAGIYNRGKVLGPQTAIVSLLGYGYLVYERSSRGLGWGGYALAAALSVGIVPYTALVMAPTNQALLRVAEGTTTCSQDAVKALLLKWKTLNVVRSLIAMTSAVLGIWELAG